ncbi:histone-lysine N-methyltransferase SETMAR [Trichonephila clavipes]|uniref:Histone-lysine N-methyltransferase SETMAR n=1 Tax=Trichonephila clavipes TaxID=2585209 RepID=A0A8X6RPZ3_TRICX|nr:histone-lysine N-methyltransferase SETMAR [Trichonephila clavipes]
MSPSEQEEDERGPRPTSSIKDLFKKWDAVRAMFLECNQTKLMSVGKNANQVAEIGNGVNGDDTVTANYVQFWFLRYCSGIFDVKFAPRTGRPVVKNVDKIPKIIEVNRHVSSHSITQELNIDNKTVFGYLSKVGFKMKLDVWVQHQLTPKNNMDRISICEALDKVNEIGPFLKWIVTEDEKWVTYDNIVRKRSWSKRGEAAQMVARPGLTSKKVLLCIWWNWKGIIHYEFLYCQQLDLSKLAIDQKRPEFANRRGVMFHQDNATPHTSVVTRQKLWELGCEVLMHPPYRTNLEPNDYYVFLALQNFLSDKKLGSRGDCENLLL